MKKIVIMLALVVALGGCAGSVAKALGGSNSVHFDGTKTVVVRLYGTDESGERVLLSETTTTTGGVITGDTLAGIGRGIEGVTSGSVDYNAQTGVLSIDFDESAQIDGGVAADFLSAFKAGAEAYRDASVAESENEGGRAALAEFQKAFDARLAAIQADIDKLLEAQSAGEE